MANESADQAVFAGQQIAREKWHRMGAINFDPVLGKFSGHCIECGAMLLVEAVEGCGWLRAGSSQVMTCAAVQRKKKRAAARRKESRGDKRHRTV